MPRRIGMTDNMRGPTGPVALEALRRGEALILRNYGTPSQASATSLARAGQARHVRVLKAGKPQWPGRYDVGTHLPEWALRRYGGMVRRIGRQSLVTAATHNESAIIAAARAGVCAILISPVFATASHPGGDHLGLVRFARLTIKARSCGLQVYALGGTGSRQSIRRLNGLPVTGIAGISFLLKPETAQA